MGRYAIGVVGLLLVALSACQATSSSSAARSPALVTRPSESSSAGACDLVSASRASLLVGYDIGPGTEKTDDGIQSCVYGTSPDVLTISVGTAPSSAAAQSLAATAQKMEIGPLASSPTVAVWPNVGDGAFTTLGIEYRNGSPISTSALYGSRGPTYFAITDLAVGPVPGPDALVTMAGELLTKLP
jgi:hypothetical protein